MSLERKYAQTSNILILSAISFFLLGLILLMIASVISFGNTIRPQGIVIHHSAVPIPMGVDVLNAHLIDNIHRQRGFGIFYWGTIYNIGYHYVILPDGTVEKGRPEKCQGAHTKGHNDEIGICLIGDFSVNDNVNSEKGPKLPTKEQVQALARIVNDLRAKYDILPEKIRTHRELDPKTECPGDNFPSNNFRGR